LRRRKKGILESRVRKLLGFSLRGFQRKKTSQSYTRLVLKWVSKGKKREEKRVRKKEERTWSDKPQFQVEQLALIQYSARKSP